MARALAAMRAHRHLVDGEADLAQARDKPAIGMRRPDREHATRTQCRHRCGEAGHRVQPVVADPRQSVGAVVDIEQDRVENRSFAPDHHRDVAFAHFDTRVIEWKTGMPTERPAIPRDDARHQFGDDDTRILAETAWGGRWYGKALSAGVYLLAAGFVVVNFARPESGLLAQFSAAMQVPGSLW